MVRWRVAWLGLGESKISGIGLGRRAARVIQEINQLSRHYSLGGNTYKKYPGEVSLRLTSFLAATDFAFPSSFCSISFLHIIYRGQSTCQAFT